MKKLILTLIILAILGSVIYAQNSKEIFFCGFSHNNYSNKISKTVHLHNYNIDKNAENAVKKILDAVGLPQNFVLVPYPDFGVAAAFTDNKGIRYIVYDSEFIKGINDITTNWSSVSILAHEIGHHLGGHTLKGSLSLVEQREKELEADEFSGFILAKLGATLGQAKTAINLIATENDDTFSTHPKRSKRLAAIENGYNKAKFNGQQILEKVEKSKSAESYFTDGFLFHDAGYYKEAITEYNKAINLKPNFAACYINRGNSKFLLNNFFGAKKDFQEAIKIDTDNYTAYMNLGLIEVELGNYLDGLKLLNKSISINNLEASVFFNRGILYSKRGNNKKAKKDFKKAIEIDNTYGDAYTAIGYILVGEESYREAIKFLYQALGHNTKAEGLVYNNLGIAQYHTNRKRDACKNWKLACNNGENEGCKSFRHLCK